MTVGKRSVGGRWSFGGAGMGGRGDFDGNDAKEGKPSMWRAVGCWRQQGVDLVASRAEQGCEGSPTPKIARGVVVYCRRRVCESGDGDSDRQTRECESITSKRCRRRRAHEAVNKGRVGGLCCRLGKVCVSVPPTGNKQALGRLEWMAMRRQQRPFLLGQDQVPAVAAAVACDARNLAARGEGGGEASGGAGEPLGVTFACHSVAWGNIFSGRAPKSGCITFRQGVEGEDAFW